MDVIRNTTHWLWIYCGQLLADLKLTTVKQGKWKDVLLTPIATQLTSDKIICWPKGSVKHIFTINPYIQWIHKKIACWHVVIQNIVSIFYDQPRGITYWRLDWGRDARRVWMIFAKICACTLDGNMYQSIFGDHKWRLCQYSSPL